mmetsp:Transcript_521/g.1067  ORF Transcript_521/g.1067 Transcript_521/m.1067 type:complete len:313 (-) Transcript_521:391-1329(-)
MDRGAPFPLNDSFAITNTVRRSHAQSILPPQLLGSILRHHSKRLRLRPRHLLDEDHIPFEPLPPISPLAQIGTQIHRVHARGCQFHVGLLTRQFEHVRGRFQIFGVEQQRGQIVHFLGRFVLDFVKRPLHIHALIIVLSLFVLVIVGIDFFARVRVDYMCLHVAGIAAIVQIGLVPYLSQSQQPLPLLCPLRIFLGLLSYPLQLQGPRMIRPPFQRLMEVHVSHVVLSPKVPLGGHEDQPVHHAVFGHVTFEEQFERLVDPVDFFVVALGMDEDGAPQLRGGGGVVLVFEETGPLTEGFGTVDGGIGSDGWI